MFGGKCFNTWIFFSLGLGTITELDFAKILLRYTRLDLDAYVISSFSFQLFSANNTISFLFSSRYDDFLERLIQSDAEEKGITFTEFHDFCTFLNNLDDFSIAMRMYSLADRPISESKNTSKPI